MGMVSNDTRIWVADMEPSTRYPLYTRGNTGEVFPNVITALTGSPALADATILCAAVDLPRALPAAALADLWRAAAHDPGRVRDVPSVDDGIRQALASATGPIVVAGSLYLVGAVRGQLVGGLSP